MIEWKSCRKTGGELMKVSVSAAEQTKVKSLIKLQDALIAGRIEMAIYAKGKPAQKMKATPWAIAVGSQNNRCHLCCRGAGVRLFQFLNA